MILPKSPFPCPVCGKKVPAKARACPHCGACDKTGWNEEARANDGLDLPDDEFDYEKFNEEEFGRPRKRRRKEILMWITALVLLIAFILTGVSNLLFRQ
jgi:predicted nucleic acid-binding Zn ribbon protein